jgi:uncharacterized protein YcbK (DUF882 family)
MKKIFIFLLLLSSTAVFAQGRFYYEGDGCLSLLNRKTNQKFDGCYRDKNGEYDSIQLDKLNVFFQIPTDLGDAFSLRTLAFIDFLQDKYVPNKKTRLKITSAYRSPAYNEALRKKGALAGKTSYHMVGMAADLVFPGVKSLDVWNYAKSLNYGGVGYYRNKSLHIDSGKPRSWTPENAIDPDNKPPLNENIYLSVDRDIYKTGETMNMFFSGISDYPFGVKKKMELRNEKGLITTITPTWNKELKKECVVVDEFSLGRKVSWKIPEKFKLTGEKIFVEVTFCDPTYAKMPKILRSRSFEVKDSLSI